MWRRAWPQIGKVEQIGEVVGGQRGRPRAHDIDPSVRQSL
jgi:hypothetical protein